MTGVGDAGKKEKNQNRGDLMQSDAASGEKIRNVAVLVAGTDEEYQGSVLSGIAEGAKLCNFNVSVFASFGGVLFNEQNDIGEYNIYSLVNYDLFDGVILLTNTISDLKVRARICADVIRSGKPAVVFDDDSNPEFYNICINNNDAMRKIIAHVIEHHGAKVVNYISGPLGNPEAKMRYQAFLDVMAEHDLPVEEERIYFGEFRPIDGKRAAEQMLTCGLRLPDAVVCANDAMALEAVTVLQAHGVRVPQDVIVTGFDNTYFAQHYNPTLTSVARPLSEAGKNACSMLDRIFRGEAQAHTFTLHAEPVFDESCGCVRPDTLDIAGYKTETYDLIRRFRSDTSLLCRMTTALAANETPEESINILSQYLHEINCQQCCICLCDNWESAFHEGSDGMRTERYQVEGYTDQMTASVILDKGQFSAVQHFKSAQMFPVPLTDGGNISYFFSMHFRERCLGYYIFMNTDFPTRSMLCHMLMINISHSYENIRKLLSLNNAIRDLDRLYVTDPLCGIYNRSGFLRLADKLFRECCTEHKPLMISFIDMDGLKLINDNYGHDEGDFALRELAHAIRSNCVGNQICARFGGDEFIVIGSGFTQEEAQRFEKTFADRLTTVNGIIHKPYPLSASVGTFITEVEEDMKLFALISQADQIMYEQKKRKKTSRYLRRE